LLAAQKNAFVVSLQVLHPLPDHLPEARAYLLNAIAAKQSEKMTQQGCVDFRLDRVQSTVAVSISAVLGVKINPFQQF